MRVLAFEDSFDIGKLLSSAGVEVENMTFRQCWNTEDWLEQIREFAPDVLLLDHFIPPTKGLEVLQSLNLAVANGEVERPHVVVGMSSASTANQRMLQFGADFAVLKFDLPSLEFWALNSEG